LPANRPSLLALIGHNHPIAIARVDEIVEVIAKAKQEGQDLWEQGPERTRIVEVMDVDDETPVESRAGTPMAEVPVIAAPPPASLWSVAKGESCPAQ
jgi:hypothetical protein